MLLVPKAPCTTDLRNSAGQGQGFTLFAEGPEPGWYAGLLRDLCSPVRRLQQHAKAILVAINRTSLKQEMCFLTPTRRIFSVFLHCPCTELLAANLNASVINPRCTYVYIVSELWLVLTGLRE